MPIHEKSFFSPKKWIFPWYSACLIVFIKKINKKHWILPQYTFFLKKIIKDVFFKVFRSIKGILYKTTFYMYNICNLNKEENSALKVTFSRFFTYFQLLVKENQINTFFSRQCFFSLKLLKLPIFMLLFLFYYKVYFFSKTA